MLKSRSTLVILGIMFFVLSLLTCFTDINKYISLAIAAMIVAASSYIYTKLEYKKRDLAIKIFAFLASLAVILSIKLFFAPIYYTSIIDTLLLAVDTWIINILFSVEDVAVDLCEIKN